MESIVAQVSALLPGNPVDFPVDRHSRRFGLALFVFLLAWSYNKEVEISCFAPANFTRHNAAAFDQYCKTSTLFVFERPTVIRPKGNNATTYLDPSFRIHGIPALYHILLAHCLVIMLPSIWYSSGARCILGDCIGDLLKTVKDNQPTEKELESKFAFEFAHENGAKRIQKSSVEVKGTRTSHIG